MKVGCMRLAMRRVLLGVAAMTVGTSFQSCSAAWEIFRGEASESIGNGVKTILNGVVDGLVAVIDPTDAQSQAASASSSSSLRSVR